MADQLNGQTAEEQAALRRVATLVAQAAPPEEVFAAIAEEAGRLLVVGHAMLSRYDPDRALSAVAAWTSTGATVAVGTRVVLGGRNVHTLVSQTGRAVRLDDYTGVSGAVADVGRGYDPVGGWASTGAVKTFPVGTSVRLGGQNVVIVILRSEQNSAAARA
jgi:hypothetical protein